MENKATQFLIKLESFPEEARLYLSSDSSSSSTKELREDYNLKAEVLDNLIYDFFISDFNLDVLKKNLSSALDNKGMLDKVVCDFIGKLFLPIAPFIEMRAEEIIEKHKGLPSKYDKYIDEFNDLVEYENIENLAEFVDNFDKDFDKNQEEKIVLHFLEKEIYSILEASDHSGRQKLNGSIIILLLNKDDFQGKAVRAFLSNKEELGSNKINLEGQKLPPTISNWIKHFIKENGSEIFSNIKLAKYLADAENVKALDEKDKKVLRKVLKVYRNLSFFPDSMAKNPIENWEIIPIEPELSSSHKKKLPEKKKIEIKKEDLKDEDLLTLESMREKYPEKSLERKAIELEIKKRKK